MYHSTLLRCNSVSPGNKETVNFRAQPDSKGNKYCNYYQCFVFHAEEAGGDIVAKADLI